ncbi:hypothetical protein MKJ01_06845 [Chryseobacterium sp. SSA4.19]|uniref:hypothetical protein n=1 Tax=Chryseobacterium sp. SSA4.19 TaxID=2919915 RepID=UPI001F4D4FB3|nr:hypothetical protein [Chryseobacterium sp. SSA4.19]MCJ8153480.1 hypothetical protein [Chryseobacterium sp. SSA4.19]
MKGLLTAAGIAAASLLLTSCVVHDHPGRRGMPPGHAKKIYRHDKGGHGHGHHKHRGRGHEHHRR